MRAYLTVFGVLLFSSEALSGAWGAGSFENDTASDWAYSIENTKGSEVLLSTMRAVLTPGYKDSDLCTNAIAAAEVVASLKDGESSNLPESLAKWVVLNKSIYEPEMAKFALKAVQSCKNTTDSELAQLWNEGDPNDWGAEIKQLESRLKDKRITRL